MIKNKKNLPNKLLTFGIGASLLASSLSIFADTLATLNSAPDASAVKDQYIVVLKDSYIDEISSSISGVTNSDSAAISKQVVGYVSQDIVDEYNADLIHEYTSAISGFAINIDASEIEELLKDDRISYIEQDQIISTNVVQQDAIWGLDRIDQKDLPFDNEYNYDYSGKGVNAYVIDTGIDSSHPDFGGRVASGVDFVDDGNGSEDCAGHGTHVAGTIGSNTYGVAKDVTLVPVRVLDCDGSGYVSDAIAGLDWVLENASIPAVVNMSLSGGGISSYTTVINSLIDNNIIVVVAAGNDDDDACNYAPSGVIDAITVAASTSSDVRASFSNYGDCVDIFGPGLSILSTNLDGTASYKSGTSMASPHVAGVAALYLEKNPNADQYDVEEELESQAAADKIIDTLESPNLLIQTKFSESSSTLSIKSATDYGESDGTYPASNTIDGSLAWSSRWQAEGLLANLELDLGSAQHVTDVGISFGKGGDFSYGFEIWARETTGDEWVKVLSQTNTSGTTSSIESYDIEDIDAQFVRIKTRSNTGDTDVTIIKEVELYGEETSAENEIAIEKAFDGGNSIDAYTASNAIDNDTDFESRWSAYNDFAEVNLTIQLDTVSTVESMDIAWGLGDEYIYEFEVYARPETSGSWTKIFDSFSSGSTSDLETFDLIDINAKQVRIKSFGSDAGDGITDIKEVKIYGASE